MPYRLVEGLEKLCEFLSVQAGQLCRIAVCEWIASADGGMGFHDSDAYGNLDSCKCVHDDETQSPIKLVNIPNVVERRAVHEVFGSVRVFAEWIEVTGQTIVSDGAKNATKPIFIFDHQLARKELGNEIVFVLAPFRISSR